MYKLQAVVQSVPTSSDVADSSLTVTAACNDTESSDEEYNPDNSSGDEEEEEEEMEEEEGHGMQDAEMVNEEEIKDVDREEGDRVTTKNSSEGTCIHVHIYLCIYSKFVCWCSGPSLPTSLGSTHSFNMCTFMYMHVQCSIVHVQCSIVHVQCTCLYV